MHQVKAVEDFLVDHSDLVSPEAAEGIAKRARGVALDGEFSDVFVEEVMGSVLLAEMFRHLALTR